MEPSFDPTVLVNALASLRDDPEALIAIIVRQAEQIVALQATVAALQARLDELEPQPPSSVAPFRIDPQKRSQTPKTPGRKAGHVGCYRQAPEPTEEITVSLACCPCCGGPIEALEPLEQYIEELPFVRPRHIRLITYKARCARCGLVHSTHPLQTSKAVGAAGLQWGPTALSVMAKLQYSFHLSKRKTCQLLTSLFGLSISPGGLVEAMHRLAGRLYDQDKALVETLRGQKVIYSDETGWYVGAPGYGLWVFTNEVLTLYRIVKSRNRAELQKTIGTDFQGVLVSDCLSVYDQASAVQHKCYSHHLRAISKAIAAHPQAGEGFLLELQALLKSAMLLKALGPQLDAAVYAQSRRALSQKAEALLTLPRGQPQEERVRQRLFKQRDHLFTFLDYKEVEATNNQAERQLRPAVIARKVSCGNRTEKGARTFEVLASLAATCHQTGQDLAALIRTALACPLHPAPTR
jgi:transposase